MRKFFWYSSSCGRIEFQLTMREAKRGYHSGQCETDVLELRKTARIKAMLAKLKPDAVRLVLKEFGTWDATELADHDANLTRILWIACGDVTVQPNEVEA